MQLRTYQREAIDSLYAYFQSGPAGHPIVAIPTGGGKSVVIAEFVREALGLWPDQRILMLTHVKELVAQNLDKLETLWPGAPVGVYSASLGQRELAEPITFASIQSIYRRAEELGHVDLVIVDECHLIRHVDDGKGDDSGMYRGFLSELQKINPSVRVIGFTATPYRLDSGQLTEGDGRLFTDVCFEVTIRELLDAGHICEITNPMANLVTADLSGVKKRGGDYIDSQAADAMMEITEQAVRQAMEVAVDRGRWLVFCVTVEHAKQTAAMLAEHGLEVRSIDGKTPQKDRDEVIRAYRDGEMDALVNVGVLTTGFDAPEVDAIINLRPTQSPGLWLQMLGRGMRNAPGKNDCLILDFAGNLARLGPIDQISGPRKSASQGGGEAPTRKCKGCESMIHTSFTECPVCGAPQPEREYKGQSSADDAAAMSHQSKSVTLSVWQMTMHKHTSKRGNTCLRIDYLCGAKTISEYLQPHRFAAQLDVLKSMATADVAGKGIRNIESVVQNADAFRAPAKITYHMDGKYPRITNREFYEEVTV